MNLVSGFAVVIQFMMACIALSSLLVKRHREHPRRPYLVWAFDTSKQALASGIVHFVNVFLSYISGGFSTPEAANPCLWYFLNILLDTTIGVGILYIFLKLLQRLVDHYRIPNMKSGFYGNPPQLSIWIRQTILFITAWFFVKISVLILLAIFPFIVSFGEWILSPLEQSGDSKLQVIVVMLIFPLIMNIIQAWLIDMLIKGKQDFNYDTKYWAEEPSFSELDNDLLDHEESMLNHSAESSTNLIPDPHTITKPAIAQSRPSTQSSPSQNVQAKRRHSQDKLPLWSNQSFEDDEDDEGNPTLSRSLGSKLRLD